MSARPKPLTREQLQHAEREARAAIDARNVACTCLAWTTVAPAYHERWCEREVEEHREYARVIAALEGGR